MIQAAEACGGVSVRPVPYFEESQREHQQSQKCEQKQNGKSKSQMTLDLISVLMRNALSRSNTSAWSSMCWNSWTSSTLFSCTVHTNLELKFHLTFETRGSFFAQKSSSNFVRFGERVKNADNPPRFAKKILQSDF